MKTERLYYADAYAREFTARVVERRPRGDRPGVVLDRTLFYPASGGQPHDTGRLNGAPVVDVIEEGESIVHLLGDPLTGDIVTGEVDWSRRFDHMQQHTGQHILSQVFVRELGAETVSFHLGAEISSIDVDAAPLSIEQLQAAEDAANEVVFGNLPVNATFVTPDRLAELPLRKPPVVHEHIRIVEVAGFDWSPCGGTHCRAAGEVGLIKVRRVERRGADTRVEFLCGRRALLDYRWKNEHVLSLAAALSIRDREAVDAVLGLLQEGKEREKRNQQLRDRLLDYEATEALGRAERHGRAAVVVLSLQDREVDEVKRLGLKLVAGDGVVALLGLRGKKGHLLFARSADLDCDMGALLREACGLVGGRGGGTSALAQGGAPDPERLDEALAAAREQVLACLL